MLIFIFGLSECTERAHSLRCVFVRNHHRSVLVVYWSDGVKLIFCETTKNFNILQIYTNNALQRSSKIIARQFEVQRVRMFLLIIVGTDRHPRTPRVCSRSCARRGRGARIRRIAPALDRAGPAAAAGRTALAPSVGPTREPAGPRSATAAHLLPTHALTLQFILRMLNVEIPVIRRSA